MINDIKVSVILPSLNVKKYIRECIDSVIHQTLKEIEVIFIDAGSTDGTLEILEEYSSKDDRITLMKSDKKSYGYQVNLGIKQARGKYIGIVETDDFIDPKMYEELYDYACRLNADVVKSPYIDYYSKKRSMVCYYAESLNSILPDHCFSCKEYGHLLGYHASVWAGLYKKEYLTENDIYFVEALGAGYVDVGFRYDSCINTQNCAWYPKPLYFYRVSSEGSSTNNFNLGTMIRRWNELHIKSQTIKEDFDRYYGPYLVFDEYLNTVVYLKVKSISKEEFAMLKENISYLNEDMVLNSPVMKQYEKNDLLSFMRNPEKYMDRYQPFIPVIGLFKRSLNRFFPKGSRRRAFLKKIRLLLRKI